MPVMEEMYQSESKLDYILPKVDIMSESEQLDISFIKRQGNIS